MHGNPRLPGLLALLAFVAPGLLPAQGAAPAGEPARLRPLLQHGAEHLEREDPLQAWQAFREALRTAPDDPDARLGRARVHLLLGAGALAVDDARAVLQQQPGRADAMAAEVRGLIRDRRFDEAVATAERCVLRLAAPGAELCAARASALFRILRIDAAAEGYQRVLALDPQHGEAHLRLGSGLLPPRAVTVGPALETAVAAARRGELTTAADHLLALLQQEPGNPVAHRLLGEVLWHLRAAASMASQDPAFARLRELLPRPDVRHLPVDEFIPGYAQLAPHRRLVVDRTMALFGSHLPRLLAMGSRHDLLQETERTTDAGARAGLRGQRTHDGRVWDDVRGIGGLRAATGIEALDEAAALGFDTLAHEVAHQVHFYGLGQVQRARIRELYRKAQAEDRWLDHYAATNEAEYFGQGVEAFAALGKRPGGETTHGHTRFELYRVDPALHDLIASLVDQDPLRDAAVRDELLAAAAAVALRCGRFDDAAVAVAMMAAGPAQEEWRLRCAAAAAAWRGG